MKTKYQIIKIGSDNPFYKEVMDTLYHHTAELGLEKESIIEIDETNFNTEYKGSAPTFCLYFGSDSDSFKNIDLLEILIKDANLILPIASDLAKFSSQIPTELGNVNGFELATSNDIEKLVSCILEGLSLLRLSRRLFISYKRDESSTVAIQLFEQLEKNGFDVFLDTHSIRPGEPFQEELWHRMADTDVVVLLNTPGFLNSNWTTQELAKANSMSIGILQVIWPSHKLERDAELSIPLQLSDSDFGNKIFKKTTSYLNPITISNIISQVESLRARSLASRQDNIITEFIASSNRVGKKADLQSEKFITIKRSDGKELVIIPTVGVPQAFTYNQSEELVVRIKSKNVAGAFLLFDHRNIREKWIKHLDWLDNYLPVKTIKIVKAEEWLKTI
ncbi:MAG: toll/interleukin-1 receptor domain-containing protein [Reichenbachiella sp.]|uniref:toll/interleukin-1 receptor domain-containing protein n=1 Tax=Reichenbachiella sp. TaxID=2184521 RepID=UPI00326786EE